MAIDYKASGSLLYVFHNSHQMSNLHYRFMGDNSPTDVLTFNLAEESADNYIEGEIYVDLQTAAKQADEFGITYNEETARLCIHGFLHLLGYDDLKPTAKKKMWQVQERYISIFTKDN